MEESDIISSLKGRIYYNPEENAYEVADKFISGNVIEKAERIESWLLDHPDHEEAKQSLADAFDRAFTNARSDRNDAENFKKPLQIPQIVVAAMHYEAHPARAGKLHHRPIDPADMVAQKQYAAFLRDVFDAVYVDLIAKFHKRND